MGKISSEKLVREFVEKIINEIGLEAKVLVKENKDLLEVDITGENLGALIGYHGETLESLQLLTALVLNKNLGEKDEWKRVAIDIGGWRKERSTNLVSQIEAVVAEMKEQNLERRALTSMSASQRREAHVVISEQFPDFATESEGDEPNRRVVLIRKS